MIAPLHIALDRAGKLSLAAQIYGAIRDAVREGRLDGDARLPSWRDLAAELGVARGTVKVAYERLADEQLIVSMGAAGTRVAKGIALPARDKQTETSPLPAFFQDFERQPAVFQMGVPAQDAFPYKLWARIMTRAARTAAAACVSYPDPRGHPDLRREIAGYLAIARGIRCTPAQVVVTAGYAGGLGLALRALGLGGTSAWLEEPGFPITRMALELANLAITPVPVDEAGIDVAEGIRRAPSARLAVVTPGQQAPLGMAMSLERRLALIRWAKQAGAWIVEDDYLSELQLKGRAAPALASLDPDGQVLHIGSFSKTISPGLRLGFLVVPQRIAALLGDAAGCLAPAPNSAIQHAVSEFMRDGHYLRHIRRMKRLYMARRDALLAALADTALTVNKSTGLAVRIELPEGTNDMAVATQALAFGLSPVPISPWYIEPPKRSGVLLGVANLSAKRLVADCARLAELVERHG